MKGHSPIVSDRVSNKLVSILIPVFNGCDSIKEALLSVLDQDYLNTEIIIVDDASTDRTKDVIDSLPNLKSLKYIRHSMNQGTSAARNTGFFHAKGDFIALLDQDDIWFPQNLTKQIFVFEKNPEIDFVFTNGYLGNKNSLISDTPVSSFQMKFSKNTWPLKEIVPFPSGWCFKKTITEKVQFDFKNFPLVYGDGDFFMRVIQSFNVYFLNEPLTFKALRKQPKKEKIDTVMTQERFLNHYQDLLSRDKPYYFRSLKTLGKDFLNVNLKKKACAYWWKAYQVDPLKFGILGKIIKTFF